MTFVQRADNDRMEEIEREKKIVFCGWIVPCQYKQLELFSELKFPFFYLKKTDSLIWRHSENDF